MAKKVVKKAKASVKPAKAKAKKAPAKKTAPKKAAKKSVKASAKKSKPAPKKAVAKKVSKPAKPAKKAAKPAKKVVKKVVAKKPVKKVAPAKTVKKAAPKAKKVVEKKVVKPVKAAKPVKPAKAQPKAKVTKAAPAPEPKAKTPTPALPQVEMEIKKAPTKAAKSPSQESNILNRPVDLSKLNLSAEAIPHNKVVEPAKSIKHVQTDKRSRYSDEELSEFKDIILKKLAEAQKDYDILKDTLSHKDDHGTDDTSPTFKLLEDGSDVLSKEETAQLASRQQKFIESLENALIRIENKTYGICRVTGNLISKDRLRSVPHATLSIEAKLDQNAR